MDGQNARQECELNAVIAWGGEYTANNTIAERLKIMSALSFKTENLPRISWQTVAILVLLTSQAVLLAILSCRAFNASFQTRSSELQRLEAAAERIDAALVEMKDRRGSAFGVDEAKESTQERMRAVYDRAGRLDDDVAARDAQIRELQGQLNEARDKILALEISAKRNEERMKSLVDSLRTETGKLAGGNR
jgi:low affinity Fe/Cu permease